MTMFALVPTQRCGRGLDRFRPPGDLHRGCSYDDDLFFGVMPSHPRLRRKVYNPYLSYFLSLPAGCIRDPNLPLDDNLEGAIPSWLEFKFPIVSYFSWAVPTQSAVDVVVRHAERVVEIGAGSGYWAWLLSQAGAAVMAFDCSPRSNTWYPVYPGDERSAAEYYNAALFLCWPPAGTDMAFNALSNFRGDCVIYVGEWMRGNAEPEFFRLLSEAFERIESVAIPQWLMRTDRLSVYKRV
jgi:hypothetical protein